MNYPHHVDLSQASPTQGSPYPSRPRNPSVPPQPPPNAPMAHARPGPQHYHHMPPVGYPTRHQTRYSQAGGPVPNISLDRAMPPAHYDPMRHPSFPQSPNTNPIRPSPLELLPDGAYTPGATGDFSSSHPSASSASSMGSPLPFGDEFTGQDNSQTPIDEYQAGGSARGGGRSRQDRRWVEKRCRRKVNTTYTNLKEYLFSIGMPQDDANTKAKFHEKAIDFIRGIVQEKEELAQKLQAMEREMAQYGADRYRRMSGAVGGPPMYLPQQQGAYVPQPHQ